MRAVATPPAERKKNPLEKGGTYHVAVTGAYESDDKSDLYLSVLAGTEEGQEDKTFKNTFWAPSGTADQIKNANIRLTALAVATNVIHPSEKGIAFDIDFKALKGCHFIAKVTINNKGYAQIDYEHMYHIDDPRVAGVPKFEAAYGSDIFQTVRRKAAEFLEGAAAEDAKEREDFF